ncbi:MAG: hypothetical protein BGO78_17135 [Chloroflexi bacterium 44-23]|nr:MAG: hypothetical protein BGO78_17135 [Chloroflexi bacterium 44-23]
MLHKKDRSPIVRNRVKEYLLVTLMSFAASVSLTRLFLELTGYPTLGKGELHIAHVLWGGLLLFAGSLMPLIFSNRWALDISAFLSGTGIGLFIDEVGKFITQSNDYFHPSAAPIIYAFFLLTVLLYIELQRPKKITTRQSLYEALQELEELLDNDFSIKEHRHTIKKLDFVLENSDDLQQIELATSLKEFLQNRILNLIPHEPSFFERWYYRYRRFEAKWFMKQRLRLLLAFALIAWGFYSVLEPFILIRAFNQPEIITTIIENLINRNLVNSSTGLNWFQTQIGLEGTLGLLSIVAGILILLKKDRIGVRAGIAIFLVMLTFANLLMFYFNQFSTIFNAIIQFLIFLLLIRYRQRFLSSKYSESITDNQADERE